MKHFPFGLIAFCVVLVFIPALLLAMSVQKHDVYKRKCELSGGIFMQSAGAGYVCFDKKAEIKP